MFRKFNISFVLLFIFNSANAGWVVRDATVIAVANTSNNENKFGVKATGGSLNLCEGHYVMFPASDAGSPEIHQRAFAAALTALTTGRKVTIHNYHDDTCVRASFIELTE